MPRVGARASSSTIVQICLTDAQLGRTGKEKLTASCEFGSPTLVSSIAIDRSENCTRHIPIILQSPSPRTGSRAAQRVHKPAPRHWGRSRRFPAAHSLRACSAAARALAATSSDAGLRPAALPCLTMMEIDGWVCRQSVLFALAGAGSRFAKTLNLFNLPRNACFKPVSGAKPLRWATQSQRAPALPANGFPGATGPRRAATRRRGRTG